MIHLCMNNPNAMILNKRLNQFAIFLSNITINFFFFHF